MPKRATPEGNPSGVVELKTDKHLEKQMNNNSWKYVKPLLDPHAIEKFEQTHGIIFPDDLKEIMKKNNGGRPPLKYYDLASEKNKEFKTLLSFNKSDIENIFKFYPLDSKDQTIIPFASDPAGNFFVLKNNKIYLWNHESDSLSFLADSFSIFYSSLHS